LFPISSSDSQKVKKSNLVSGWYVMKIEVVKNSQPFFFEESIFID